MSFTSSNVWRRFLSARKARRTPAALSQRGTFRPRLEALEDRCLLSAGALDTTFGSGGLVTGPSALEQAYNGAIVVQPDGKIVAGGGFLGANGYYNFGLARYNTDGSLDTSFNKTGITQTVIGVQQSAVKGLAIQSDGKIVAVGSTVPYRVFAVARYNPDGSLDNTFGSSKNGTVLTNLSGNGKDDAIAVAIDGSGRIDVAGRSGFGSVLTLVRYKSDGTLDTTFGSKNTPGYVLTPLLVKNAPGGGAALAIQSNGNILLAGNAGLVMGAARYLPTGQIDSSFGTNGIVTGLAPSGSTFAAADGVVVEKNGGIAIGGSAGSRLTLARLTSTGQLDKTFGSSGFAVNSNMNTAEAIAEGANGDLLAGGSANGYSAFAVAAFLPGGTPDTTFGAGGTSVVNGYFAAMASGPQFIQGHGKVVVVGYSSTRNIALARFQPPNTKIGSFTANPNPVAAGSSVTLTASNILNSNPTTTITQVAFYLDSNGDGILETGSDTLLGYGANNGGTWTFTFSTTGLKSGTYTLFAQAVDSSGVFSDPVAVSLAVM